MQPIVSDRCSHLLLHSTEVFLLFWVQWLATPDFLKHILEFFLVTRHQIVHTFVIGIVWTRAQLDLTSKLLKFVHAIRRQVLIVIMHALKPIVLLLVSWAKFLVPRVILV